MTAAPQAPATPANPFAAVDPFIGCQRTELPTPQGLAKTWWWPKAQVGNTHPGPVRPLGMVSVCPYSGAYPTGYGLYAKNTDGNPPQLFDQYVASGFTHFHQSGTGAIRKYYNYLRVTPLLGPINTLGYDYPLVDEYADPGYYRCTLGDTAIQCELTAAPKAAFHRYTFPKTKRANLVLDCSRGGIDIPYGRTVPTLAEVEALAPDTARAKLVVEGVPLYVWVRTNMDAWKYGVWYDDKNVGGGRALVFDHIRESTLTRFGIHFGGPTSPDEPVELALGFSWRSTEQARDNLHRATDRPVAQPLPLNWADDDPVPRGTVTPAVAGNRHNPVPSFTIIRREAEKAWSSDLGRIQVQGGTADQRTLFYTALYHSLIKPSDASDESPFWPGNGPFFYDFCTMWDIYKTQLPLLLTFYPKRGAAVLNALLTIAEQEGNFPIGYRMARGADRFQSQASALAHVNFLDAYYRGLPLDYDLALTYLDKDLHRAYGEAFLEGSTPVHPIVHTLDLSYGCHCLGQLAAAMGDAHLAEAMAPHAPRWQSAIDPDTGLLIDSTYYEGAKWNYSFRFFPDMDRRIELAGGPTHYTELLDAFFGFNCDPCDQLGDPPYPEAYAAGLALNRFQGLNNEPDMESPWTYHFAGRPDRTAQVVHTALRQSFHTGRGGLPGNDDSGAISSWYVWSAIGLFPVAGQDLILLSVPLFPEITLQLPESQLTITTDGLDAMPDTVEDPEAIPTLQSATLNGTPITGHRLTVQQLLDGGELHLRCS
ncbi:MAG: glycoside hydrolase domain-containing protein [Planctomycetota bacterium]